MYIFSSRVLLNGFLSNYTIQPIDAHQLSTVEPMIKLNLRIFRLLREIMVQKLRSYTLETSEIRTVCKPACTFSAVNRCSENIVKIILRFVQEKKAEPSAVRPVGIPIPTCSRKVVSQKCGRQLTPWLQRFSFFYWGHFMPWKSLQLPPMCLRDTWKCCNRCSSSARLLAGPMILQASCGRELYHSKNYFLNYFIQFNSSGWVQ